MNHYHSWNHSNNIVVNPSVNKADHMVKSISNSWDISHSLHFPANKSRKGKVMNRALFTNKIID